MDEWTVIDGLYEFNVKYMRIWSYFVEFHNIWIIFYVISPKVETSPFASDLMELQKTLKVEW